MCMKRKSVYTAFTLCICCAALTLCSCVPGKYSVELTTDNLGGADDSFAGQAVKGLDISKENYGIKTKISIADEDDKLKKILNTSKADLVLVLGYKTGELTENAAIYNKDTDYVIIDCEVNSGIDNLAGISYDVEESSFLAGYIAGATTETNKIGFVGGIDEKNINAFEYGFRSGIDYACAELGKSVTVTDEYVGSFDDPEKGHDLGEKLYNDGCDIVFQAAGSSGIGVINAAQEADEYVIGVDVDQSYLAPENVLTSVLKNIQTAVIITVDEYCSGGRFPSGTIHMGLKDDAVGIPKNNTLVSPSVLNRTNELRDLIIIGSIDPPATEEEYKEFVQNL